MKRLLAVVAVALIALAALWYRPVAPITYAGPVSVATRPTATAGDTVSVRVTAPIARAGTPVDIVAIGPYRTTVVKGIVEDGTADLVLPSDLTAAAGVVSLVAVVGQSMAETDLEIVASAVVDPVIPLVGARSIVADGRDTAMVAAVPEDVLGNPMPDGTAVLFTFQHASGSVETTTVEIRDTVAWVWITSDTTAGRSGVSVSAQAGRGPVVPLLEVPGRPVEFSLEALTPGVLEADGAERLAVRTEVLRDAFGNVLLDGTAVTFSAARDGVILCVREADVIDGRATAYLPHPDTPGPIVVNATVAGTTGSPLTVAFDPAAGIGGVPATAAWSDGTLVATVGPILGPRGELVRDGTGVTVNGGQGRSAIAPTVDGRAEVVLRQMDPIGQVEVVVGGVAFRVEVTR